MNSPTKVGTDTDWTNISAGGYHTLAIKSDGTLWAWGHNGNGQLGLGTTTQMNSPQFITTIGITSDTTAPVITIFTPQEGHTYNTSTVALNVTADESIDTWQYSTNGTVNVTFTPNETLPSLP